eukprot:SAG22_NODE_321_length_12398_cov_3.218392_14_plen_80_part_00
MSTPGQAPAFETEAAAAEQQQGLPIFVTVEPGPSRCYRLNRGDASNLVTFLIMAVGIGLKTQFPADVVVDCVLSAGLFG